jgi:hypothetical protein
MRGCCTERRIGGTSENPGRVDHAALEATARSIETAGKDPVPAANLVCAEVERHRGSGHRVWTRFRNTGMG